MRAISSHQEGAHVTQRCCVRRPLRKHAAEQHLLNRFFGSRGRKQGAYFYHRERSYGLNGKCVHGEHPVGLYIVVAENATALPMCVDRLVRSLIAPMAFTKNKTISTDWLLSRICKLSESSISNDMRMGRIYDQLSRCRAGQQPVKLPFDNAIALANAFFHASSIQYLNVPVAITDKSRLL